MTMIRYMLDVSADQKWKDFKEYRHLKEMFALARKRSDSCYYSLVYSCDDNERMESVKNRCIVHKFDPMDMSDGAAEPTPYVHKKYCEHFSHRGNRCTKLDCPNIQYNHMYEDSLKKVEELECAVNTFWKDKFARAK